MTVKYLVALCLFILKLSDLTKAELQERLGEVDGASTIDDATELTISDLRLNEIIMYNLFSAPCRAGYVYLMGKCIKTFGGEHSGKYLSSR